KPFIVGLVTLIACNGFFLPYQSTTYLALYQGTGGGVFRHRQARLAALAYGVFTLVALRASVPVWRGRGVIRSSRLTALPHGGDPGSNKESRLRSPIRSYESSRARLRTSASPRWPTDRSSAGRCTGGVRGSNAGAVSSYVSRICPGITSRATSIGCSLSP